MKKTAIPRTNTEDREHFFEELDKAFNTPATETLILPQVRKNDEPANAFMVSTDPRPTKRQISRTELKDTKQRRSSPVVENVRHTTGVGIRTQPHERSKSAKNLPPAKKRSSGTSLKRLNKESEKQKKSDLLSGMILLFIPNSKNNGLRRLRMTLFAQHGALVRDAWTDDITHIICDKSVSGERVLRDLRWEQFPVLLLDEIG
jgi:hypothetical protein